MAWNRPQTQSKKSGNICLDNPFVTAQPSRALSICQLRCDKETGKEWHPSCASLTMYIESDDQAVCQNLQFNNQTRWDKINTSVQTLADSQKLDLLWPSSMYGLLSPTGLGSWSDYIFFVKRERILFTFNCFFHGNIIRVREREIQFSSSHVLTLSVLFRGSSHHNGHSSIKVV